MGRDIKASGCWKACFETLEKCQALDGEVFKLKDKVVGVNYPPLHPYCRSTTGVHLDEETVEGLERRRIARNPTTGQNEYVDGDMTYSEWAEGRQSSFGADNSNKTYRENGLGDLPGRSNSPIFNLETFEDIQKYFIDNYSAQVAGFDEKDLDAVKTTLSGCDDMLCQFPDTGNFIKVIQYEENFVAYGHITYSTKTIGIGPRGLGNYGTGVHEAAHALDASRTMKLSGDYDYSTQVVGNARVNLGFFALEPDVQRWVDRIVAKNPGREMTELFAYAMEAYFCGTPNSLAAEMYRIVRDGWLE